MSKKPDVFEDVRLGPAFVQSLVQLGAKEDHALLYCRVKGLAGHQPVSLRKAHPSFTGEGVRRIIIALKENQVAGFKLTPAFQALKLELEGHLTKIASEAPNTEDGIREALALRGAHFQSPFSIYRWACDLDIDTGLRLEHWRGLSKHFNRGDKPTGHADETRLVTIDALVQASAPFIFERFLSNARRIGRTTGAISARYAAENYARERNLPVTEQEARAMLAPFAISLGRIEGEDWFVFFSSTNEFVGRTGSLVSGLGQASFESVCESYRRLTRSLFISEEPVPKEVLKRTLETFGFSVVGDKVKLMNKLVPEVGRGLSPVAAKMVEVFRDLLDKGEGEGGAVPRVKLLHALEDCGVNGVTAHVYLGRKGIFHCVRGMCTLADGARKAETVRRRAANDPGALAA